jgi:hypothetical protein
VRSEDFFTYLGEIGEGVFERDFSGDTLTQFVGDLLELRCV